MVQNITQGEGGGMGIGRTLALSSSSSSLAFSLCRSFGPARLSASFTVGSMFMPLHKHTYMCIYTYTEAFILVIHHPVYWLSLQPPSLPISKRLSPSDFVGKLENFVFRVLFGSIFDSTTVVLSNTCAIPKSYTIWIYDTYIAYGLF